MGQRLGQGRLGQFMEVSQQGSCESWTGAETIDWQGFADKHLKSPRQVEGRRVLILGNSPALEKVDLEKIPKDVITVGINRIMPLLIPDYLMLVDRSIEGRYHPKEHSLRGGLITITTSPYQHRHDAIVLIRSAGKKTTQPPWRWPRTIKDPILIPGNSACYAFQWAMLNGAGEIAMIGHDCNQNVLNEQGEKTHFYGINPVTGPKRAAGDITGE